MSHRWSSGEWEPLLHEVLSEADSESGTWSMATYLKVRSSVMRFSPSDAEQFVKQIFDAFFHTSADRTRYKLAQILSAIHQFALPDFERAFAGHGDALLYHSEQFNRAGELGKPTAALLNSLGQPPVRCTGAESRPRRLSAGHIHAVLASPSLAKYPVSRTPDPGSVT
jgi:hypothetical protein